MFNKRPKYVLTVAIFVSLVRLTAFWICNYAAWTGQQSIALLPLVLLLYPELLVMPDDWTLTVWTAIGFSVVLCVPIGLAAFLEIWITRWREKRRLSHHDS
jgi:hypothetical protein